MPVINGYETAKEIKKTQPNICLVAVTGNDDEAEKNKCMELGF